MRKPTVILMCEPLFFDVKYEGNIYMKDLPIVDIENTFLQWTSLKQKYSKLGYEIKTIPAVKGLTDIVFTANQSFPFLKKNNQKCVILSKMRNDQRKEEVKYFKELYESEGYDIFELSSNIDYFESMGDALIDYENDRIFGGYGFRTQEKVYDEIEKITEMEVIRLKLISNKFYHLDTCLSILNKDEAIMCESGFDRESVDKIYSSFRKIYNISEKDNMEGFLCNCHCPDGQNIIVQKNNSPVFKELEKNYIVHETETSEFMKSGGSVFCMKMMLW